MRARTLPMLGFAALAALAVVGLSGCSVTMTVPAADVEQQISDTLSQQIGFAPEMECPDDLKAEVGTTMVCALNDTNGDVYDTTVTVTEVVDGQVNFDIQVANAPRG